MRYIVRYIVMDSEIRWTEVEAESEEEAESKAWDDCFSVGVGGSDDIYKIIDVQQV